MGFIRMTAGFVMLVALSGCVSTGGAVPSVAYDEGYQHGIKENIAKNVEGMNGNGFPYIGGSNWAEPLIQDVRIPAHIQGGVFYPEHNELVIITPGEWKKAGGFPLRTDIRNEGERVEVLSADITALPAVIYNERAVK